MTRQIDTDAVINSVRLKEQAAAPATVDAGYWALHAREGGLYHEDDNEVTAGPLGTGLTPGGRLTLTTATPVTTADVTAAATLYYTPYLHNMIELYDGARWIPVPFVEVSLSLVGYTASKPYDIWGYLASGTVALESTIWTDGTTRATALAYQDGRLIKNGAATRRYLGTIYINSSGAQTDDSVTKRCVWNYYNRVPRRMFKTESTSHNYTTATYRAWNNDATQIITFVCGVAESPVNLSLIASIANSADGVNSNVAIGYDTTTAIIVALTSVNNQNQYSIRGGVSLYEYPAAGYHYYAIIENGGTTSTFAAATLYGQIFG